VKGITWDPVGMFLASQVNFLKRAKNLSFKTDGNIKKKQYIIKSDDKTLKIWRTSDWGLESCISDPFKQCTGTTHVLRLHWSPDGQLVISAHAINNGAPTAQVIERGNKWNTKLDFVGHRKAVTVVVC
jgi:protein HIRA/HIR1